MTVFHRQYVKGYCNVKLRGPADREALMFLRRLIKLAGYIVALIIFALCLAVLINRHDLELIKQFQSLQQVDPIPRARELAEAGEK